ncbi:hypothetical protein [Pseudomonas sp. EA_35y_Pfl2_R5]|uniref:hypothetical protein n=1 Tax=Pseudomonas sp. EA_35y_Pfl2_R5 TaxID=3088690 RepID=UPI0030D7B9A6
MELKDFVAESLLSIVEGIKDAQSKFSEHGAHINPGNLMRGTSAVAENSVWDNTNNNYAQLVSFDIAITAEDAAKAGARVKVLSGLLGGDIGGEKGTKNILASRVQFSVPVLFPTSNLEDPEARQTKQPTPKIPKPISSRRP